MKKYTPYFIAAAVASFGLYYYNRNKTSVEITGRDNATKTISYVVRHKGKERRGTWSVSQNSSLEAWNLVDPLDNVNMILRKVQGNTITIAFGPFKVTNGELGVDALVSKSATF